VRVTSQRHRDEDPSPQSSPLCGGERRILSPAGMNISAALLAGGESRRMGREKATILFRGKPLWQIQLDLLRALNPKEILVSARTDPVWRPADAHFVSDIPPSRGPLSGLAASLDRMCGTHLLALAVDMPLISEKYLRHLCDKIESHVGVVPRIHGRAEPLAAIYPREAVTEFQCALSGADFSLQTVTRLLVQSGKLREVVITEQEQSLFLNVNQLSDLQSV
jgi:molybdenum cofactor guanylyltransferase